MLLFSGIALLNGMVSIINKMVNLQAKRALGTANGTLINYLEATAISFVIVLFTGSGRLTDLSYLRSVPPVTFLGGLFGLTSMVLILNGMEKARISYSTVVVLIGQLGTGFVIDSMMTGKIVPSKIAGMLLVVAGVFLDSRLSGGPKEAPSAEAP